MARQGSGGRAPHGEIHSLHAEHSHRTLRAPDTGDRPPAVGREVSRVSPKRVLRAVFSLGCLCSPLFFVGVPWAADPAGAAPANAAGEAVVIPLDDAIGPATARYVTNHLRRAESQGARAVILQLDTPGGLDTSMREIVKAILAAEVPVAVYVAPPGARAASAGFFITLAAPIAAMAPGTNIGAATPVSAGGGEVSADTTMKAKVLNDMAAYARSLAERHGRNADWAERAVRRAESLPAQEAVRDSVVDLVAESIPDLLEKMDGRTVRTASGEVTCRTAGLDFRTVEMTWRERLLALLSHPSLAYLLFLAGIMGIAMELYNPGGILPGVIGAIALILAFFAFQSLPVRAAGILLILLAAILFILEVKITSFGLLGLGGVAALVLGSVFLFEPGSAARVSLLVVIPAAATFAAFSLLAATMAARARHLPPRGGLQGMVGAIAETTDRLDPEGRVFLQGEYWNARSDVPVERGARVRVVRAEGLLLMVEPVSGSPPPTEGGSS